MEEKIEKIESAATLLITVAVMLVGMVGIIAGLIYWAWWSALIGIGGVWLGSVLLMSLEEEAHRRKVEERIAALAAENIVKHARLEGRITQRLQELDNDNKNNNEKTKL